MTTEFSLHHKHVVCSAILENTIPNNSLTHFIWSVYCKKLSVNCGRWIILGWKNWMTAWCSHLAGYFVTLVILGNHRKLASAQTIFTGCMLSDCNSLMQEWPSDNLNIGYFLDMPCKLALISFLEMINETIFLSKQSV